ncbi:MAG: carbonic anhydrase [Planctomycetota bacterium]
MSSIDSVLDKNRAWAASMTASDPDFFKNLAGGQQPEYLWVGCSDSRVPASRVAGFEPGEAFVHRNIANQVILSDLNFLSVLRYAVAVLKVKHIVVCGHYNCGGVAAAVSNGSVGVIDHWLEGIRDTNDANADQLAGIVGEEERLARLCELNVVEQVRNVCRTTAVRTAWDEGQELSVHGLIYSLEDGLLKDLNVEAKKRPGMYLA